MRRLFFITSMMALAAPLASAQPQAKPSLPDPVRFIIKYDIAWNVVRGVLVEMGHAIELEDKKGGKITTRPYEFITGSLTSSEVDKVALKNDSPTGAWLRSRYAAEILLEIVSPTTTLVTVRTRIEALSRDLDGTEKWVPLESLGKFERTILGKISMKIIGNELQYEKKGFWDKSPQPVGPNRPRPIAAPPPNRS